MSEPQTTPDLERRWIEFGFASGIMRTEADGFTLNSTQTRAQIFDPDVLPVWARYAKLRTQLQPYLASAERTYDRTGMPLMRQLALAYPNDERAAHRDDEYLLGPDVLVAPVLAPDATRRKLYLPRGRWVEFWRSVSLDKRGAPRLRSPRVLTGGRSVEVAAPANQIPLFIRAGAALPLLPADVQTLSDYGSGVVHLRDRPDERALLAWPEQGRSSTAAPTADARVRSSLQGDGSWLLQVRQRRTRTLDLTLASGVGAAVEDRPCSGHASRARSSRRSRRCTTPEP